MSNLTEVVQSVKKEFKINANGQVTASIRGASRLLGIDRMSIFKSGDFKSSKLAEIMAEQGFDAATLIAGGIPDTALALMAHYFAYESKAKSPEAQQLCKAFMAIGIRAWVHEQLGWSKPTPQPKPLIQAYRRRVDDIHNSVRNLPDGYWCIFVEAAQLLIYVESCLGYNIQEYDLLDGSIGSYWSKYRQGKPWAGKSKQFTYQFPDKRGTQTPKCYPNSELLKFREWLEKTYKQKYLNQYLLRKYSQLVPSR